MSFKSIAFTQLMATAALGAITEVGLWTNNDWYDEDLKIGVADGIAYSSDSATARSILAPKPIGGDVDDYLSKANVVRVKSIIENEAEWDHLFAKRNEVYTYEGFLRAVGKFPYFCNESNIDGVDVDEMCKKELATMFAHFVKETSYNSQWEADTNGIDLFRQGLHYIEVTWCQGATADTHPNCNYHTYGTANQAWPIQTGEQYYPRGPLQLAYNYNYGRFSNVFIDDEYDSKMYLLENPDLVAEDGFVVFSSALWFYMTPQSPKPSMHDVVTGFFEPNDVDTAQGIQGGFGSTINVINPIECGHVNASAAKRGEYYQAFLSYFEITDNSGNDGCDTESAFIGGSAGGALPGYFTLDWHWGNDFRCMPVTWQTPYSVHVKDDYKRCICEEWGAGEVNCPQA